MSEEVPKRPKLTKDETKEARNGFKYYYQNFWRKIATNAGANPVQLGVIMEVVAEHSDELLSVKRRAFDQASQTDGPWWRRRTSKIRANKDELARMVIAIQEMPGIESEYQAMDMAFDLFVMRKPERTLIMASSLAVVLLRDNRLGKDDALKEVIERATFNYYQHGFPISLRRQ